MRFVLLVGAFRSVGDAALQAGKSEAVVRRHYLDLKTVEEVTNFTKAGGGCGNCHERIEELIVEVRKETREEAKADEPPKRLTNIQKIKMIEDALEREIRPALRKDGGDIELIDVDGDFVMVSLRGACVSCAASQTTLKEYVEKKLREQVLDTLIVEEVKA